VSSLIVKNKKPAHHLGDTDSLSPNLVYFFLGSFSGLT
jgi:hypothetical protein